MKTNDTIIPNFIGIGAPKCATTWIAEVLDSHPEVFVTKPKETHFFSERWDKGTAWYMSHYTNSETYRHRGEYSVSYLDDVNAPLRIKQLLGKPKIIASIRNPIDRFISHCKHFYREGKIKENYLDLALFNKYTQEYPNLISRGFYSKNLRTYIDMFGEDHVFVIHYDDIKQSPQRVASELYTYLGVDAQFQSEVVHQKINEGSTPKYVKWVYLFARMSKIIKNMSPRFFRSIHQLRLVKMLKAKVKGNQTFHLQEEVIHELEKIYMDEINQIEKLISKHMNK